MKMEPQIAALYEKLDRELDHMPSGSRFYSVRQLLKKYDCHRGVLDRTLEQLEQQGLIRRVPQVGIFSSVTRFPEARKVLLAVQDWPSEVTLEWSRMAEAYAETHENWQLCKIMLTPGSDTISSLPTDGFAAAIIRTPSPNISRDDMRFLASLTIPVVLLNADAGSFEISNVRSADADGAMLACRHLHKCGHRRIAIVQSEPDTLPVKTRVASFARIAEILDIGLLRIDCMTSRGEYAQHKAYLGMRQYLEDHNGIADFSAVYAVTGEAVPGIMKALREFGYELPRDISIMAHSTERLGEFYHPALTAICADLEAEVEAAFTGIDLILKKQVASFRTEITMKLIERDSVKKLTPTERT